MADGEVAQKPSAGNYSVSPFVKKEVHDQIANRSAKKRVSWNWYDTWHEEHHRAFVVAKLCKADLLQEVHDSLQKAIDEGQTFEEWRKEIQPKLEGRWLGKTVGELWDELPEAEKKRLKEQAQKENRKDPEPNEKQRQEVISPKRLETIYRTNMKVAHVAGQYQSLVDEAELYPYWQYHTQEDDRVRGSHAVLNRKVFRWDDPFWDTHFPPNGWKCRCYVRSLDDDDLEEKGLKVTDSRDLKTREDKSAGGHTKLTYIIDGKEATTADGWNYNPGKVNQQIDAVADDKAEGYDPELKEQVKASLKKEEEPKPAAAPKPKQADGAHGEPKSAAAPKPKQPKSTPANKPDAPRIIEPVKPADPSVPRVIEPPKPDAKQGILQTIRGKVSRAVDRVLGWLGVPSKRSSFEKLANEGGQDTYFGNLQSKETNSTVAKNATTAQTQREEKKELALVAAQNQMAQAVGQETNQVSASIQNKLKSAQASGNRSVSNQFGQVTPAVVQHNSSNPAERYRQPIEILSSSKVNYANGLSEKQKELLGAKTKHLLESIVISKQTPISQQELPAWITNICSNKTSILKQAAVGHQDEIKAKTTRLMQAGLTGEKLADAVMNYIIGFVPLETAEVGMLPDYVITWLLREPMVHIPNLTSLTNKDVTITNRAILHAMRNTKVNGGRAADVGDLSQLTKIIEQGYYIYDKEHKNIIAFLPCQNIRSTTTTDDKKKVIKLPVNIQANNENSIPTIGKVLRSNVKEGTDRNISQYLLIPKIKKPTP